VAQIHDIQVIALWRIVRARVGGVLDSSWAKGGCVEARTPSGCPSPSMASSLMSVLANFILRDITSSERLSHVSGSSTCCLTGFICSSFTHLPCCHSPRAMLEPYSWAERRS
jgi:hypothetical protein